MERHSPALLVELVAHVFPKLLELVLAVSIVGVNDEVLEVPKELAEVFKPLALPRVIIGDL